MCNVLYRSFLGMDLTVRSITDRVAGQDELHQSIFRIESWKISTYWSASRRSKAKAIVDKKAKTKAASGRRRLEVESFFRQGSQTQEWMVWIWSILWLIKPSIILVDLIGQMASWPILNGTQSSIRAQIWSRMGSIWFSNSKRIMLNLMWVQSKPIES